MPPAAESAAAAAGPAITGVWVWSLDPVRASASARFARINGVPDAFVSVPWTGPDGTTRAVVDAFRAEGIRVHALGSGEDWASNPARARAWADRAHASGLFAGIHLDVEPWTRSGWTGREEALMAGLAAAVAEVGQVSAVPPDVDLAPWLATVAPRGFEATARAAGRVTLMSYRDTAAAILDFSAPARAALRRLRKPYRLAVDTLPSPHPGTSFAGQPAAAITRKTTAVTRQLGGDNGFQGFAVHDLSGWMALPR